MLIKTGNRFIGTVKAEWVGERAMMLLQDFAYIDNDGFEWLSTKESLIDGSSIPRFFWRVIGSPFVGLHRFASVPHDTECKLKQNPHNKVHRMYFDASVCAGLSPAKAKLMYRAIKLGGPKW